MGALQTKKRSEVDIQWEMSEKLTLLIVNE